MKNEKERENKGNMRGMKKGERNGDRDTQI